MKKSFFILFLAVWHCSLYSVDKDRLSEVLLSSKSPFNYDLQITIVPGATQNENVLVCFHGSDGDCNIANVLKTYPGICEHLVSFNLPDHGNDTNDPRKTSFGSFNELLPAIYILKKLTLDGGINTISLYGFSAGGGVAVNLIALLRGSRYEEELKIIGVSSDDRIRILSAIQNGNVILDSPLKSMDEIIDFVGPSNYLDYLASRYRCNNFRPIDSLKSFQGLSLNVLLYFSNPDEILSNRDDLIFAKRLQYYNAKGNTYVITANEGGHSGYHASLWKAYGAINKIK